ncbi:QsdR family transcriptional regulator [Mumia sp. DW29H23]|uniref:QsdR family transcriptional regulator n=1 Tax=Mumia sp. DW29H23 TaxID=3421241 RepID=UPI003D686516
MPTRVIAYEDALAVARAWFLDGRPVDMRALADRLAVGRATLYRVVGSRERLLGDVIGALSERTLDFALDRAACNGVAAGVDRIVATARIMNQSVIDFGPLRTFMRHEPESAFHILFMPTARVHSRTVAAWRRALTASAEAGDLRLPAEAGRVAYMLVRIGESMVYADLLTDREPDLDLAAALQRSLLTSASS